ncbi:nuclear transport factor 2 family protein [Sandarakinorhabdus sp. AAP62]|uniref:nuclear transport factor 2 family protein n=1 Tax=Sandarakinorhabdus sp. AAP62 TaxID=1248916 RepID=UPI0002E90FB0|nr:nuclear transport factor 2 family protein [Sandarakinorhabdus sp. AAP62]
MDNAQIAEALFAALAANDAAAVRDLCAPDFQLVQNGAPPMNLEALLKFNAVVHAAVPGWGYGDAVRAATATGFVEEHTAGGPMPDGHVLRLPVCVVADVAVGRVTHVREYFDSAIAAPLLVALARPR